MENWIAAHGLKPASIAEILGMLMNAACDIGCSNCEDESVVLL